MSFCHLNVILSFECHSVIWMSFCHLNVILSFERHSVIWMPIHSSKGHSCNLNLIPSFHCHPIIPSSFWPTNLIHVSSHHLNVIPLTIAHGDNIQSFGCHSIHSIVIWGFEMTRDENIVEWQEWCWNDVLVIWNTFPSFLSSQMSGKKCDNSWFHPYHSASSHHLCVIREFWINGKMSQMTSEWRMIFGLVWPLSLFISIQAFLRSFCEFKIKRVKEFFP